MNTVGMDPHIPPSCISWWQEYTDQCSQNIFAHGFPHELGEGIKQRAEQKTFEKIVYYMPLILTPPPTVMVIFLGNFVKTESTDTDSTNDGQIQFHLPRRIKAVLRYVL